MSKTNDTWRVAALEDHRPFADSELDAMSGGYWNFGSFFALPLPASNVTVNGGHWHLLRRWSLDPEQLPHPADRGDGPKDAMTGPARLSL
jgi:hypothetical protein